MSKKSEKRRRGKHVVWGMLLLGVALGTTAYLWKPEIFPQWLRIPIQSLSAFSGVTEKDSVTGLTTGQIVAMGLNAYQEQYCTAAQNDSEAGQDAACSAYETYKAADNDERMHGLPESQRQQLEIIRHLLAEWTGATYQRALAEAGGGTLYGHLAAREGAVREDILGMLIDQLKGSVAGGQFARTQADNAMDIIRDDVKGLGGAMSPAPVANEFFEDDYTSACATLRKVAPLLEEQVDALPDFPACILATYAADVMLSMDFGE